MTGHTDPTRWFYRSMGEVHGPLTDPQLSKLAQTNVIGPDTHVRCGRHGKWVLADRVRGLFSTPNLPRATVPTCTMSPNSANGRKHRESGSRATVSGRSLALLSRFVAASRGHWRAVSVIATLVSGVLCLIVCIDLHRRVSAMPPPESHSDVTKDQTSSLTPGEIYALASPAVCKIDVQDRHGIFVSHGTGFLVDQEGLIVTNLHVIDEAYRARVTFDNGLVRRITGVCAANEYHDLALVEIGRTKIEPLQIDARPAPPIGMRVFAIGNPHRYRNALSEGLVSGVPVNPVYGVERVQTTAAISGGSSGGPLLDEHARVVGVVTSSSVIGQNLNLAATAGQVHQLIDSRDEPIALSRFAKHEVPADDEEWELIIE